MPCLLFIHGARILFFFALSLFFFARASADQFARYFRAQVWYANQLGMESVVVDGEVVGEVTSGTKSPTLETNIALGYVPRRFARPGSRVQIDIRGRLADAEVVKSPFYKRPY